MKVRTKLRFFVYLLIFLAISIIIVHIFAVKKVRHVTAQNNVAMVVVNELNELRMLTIDYLLHDEEPRAIVWRKKYQHLLNIFDGLGGFSGKQIAIIKNMDNNLKSMGSLFNNVTDIKVHDGNSDAERFRSMMIGQLSIRSQMVISSAYELKQMVDAESKWFQNLEEWAVTSLFFILMLITFELGYITWKDIDSSLSKIETGTAALSSGSLDHRIEISGNNEFSELGKSFNNMADNLLRSYRKMEESSDVLKKSGERHRTILKTAMDGIWLVDMQGHLLEVNDAYCRMSGYSEKELLALNITDLVDSETADDIAARIKKIMVQGEDRFESRHRRKDGTIFDVEVSVQYKPNDIAHFVVFSHDITERKQTEKVQAFLAQTGTGATDESFFEGLAKFLAQSLDMNFICIDRLEKDELTARTVAVWHDGNFEDNVTYALQDTPCGDVVGKMVCCFPAGVRQLFPRDQVLQDLRAESYVGVTLFDHTGKPNGLIAVIGRSPLANRPLAEATLQMVAIRAAGELERLDAEKAMQESEERYRTLFTRAGDGIFLLSGDGSLVEVNESSARMHGYSVQEMRHMNLKDLSTPETFQRAAEMIRRIWAGDVLTFEVEHYHKDGHAFPLEISASLISSGNKSYIQCFHRDITERKRAEDEKRSFEERLKRAEKMEALGQLAGGVAHDMNNILGVLSGYSELLLEEITEESRLRSYVEHILTSSEKGAAIIQDLLTLARRGVTTLQVVNINNITTDFLKSPVYDRIQSYNSGVEFKIDLSPDLLNIRGSSVHLDKTVMNLVSNAAESITGRGTVTIRTESRYLDKPVHGYEQIREGDYVVLTVSDTGGGIPSTDLGSIFEPFYTKKKMGRSGTGLGLAIVWGTVKDHDGYIDVESIAGRGSIFTLYFPVTREDFSADQKKITVDQYMGKGETILVVDDVSEQRGVATSILSRLGYQVHAVSSGEEAVAYLQSSHADLIVLDMIMEPGIDGLETYERIISFKPRQKAIIASGFSLTERVKKAQELGAGAYVKKPYLKERIGMAVRQELDRK